MWSRLVAYSAEGKGFFLVLHLLNVGYGALYPDLRRGIQDALGPQPLPQLWQACFDQVNDKQGRTVEEIEFQFVLEALLDGPVRNTHQHLVLIVEGLSTVK